MNDLDQAVLAFERADVEAHGALHRPAKSAGIAGELHLTTTRYYQILNRLTHDPDALAAWPGLSRAVDARHAAALRGGTLDRYRSRRSTAA